MLIALRQQADNGRLARIAGIGRRKPRIFQLEDMALDLEACLEPIAALTELFENRRYSPRVAKGTGHLLGEVQIARHPPGRRSAAP